MSTDIERSISDSLEVNDVLLPHLPLLLQDLWVLGSSVDQILEVVGTLGLPNDSKVLDLGCGKGGVSIQLAAKYGFHVVGIDGMIPFLNEAKKKSVEYKVSQLCEFINQDINEFVLQEHEFDLVILAALGGIFGSFGHSVGKLRTQIRSGGYMIIDDGFLRKSDSHKRKGYEHYKNYETTLQELLAFNDHLIKEVSTSAVSKKINEEYMNFIRKRGYELIQKLPELENEIRSYIRLQEEECEVLENEIEGALWVIQKG
ncbi:MAG: class I SAM-dependent methyltransferase [Bacteroidota bacterium]|nr:class I SAM-dependent methyltransferase [Bacteroidota bacterium]